MSGFRGNNNRPSGGSPPPRGGGFGGGGSRPAAPTAQSAASGAEPGRGRLEDLLRPPSEPIRYFSANDPKAVNAHLLGEAAEAVAKLLKDVPGSQLRRFYAEVMALKRRAELTPTSDDEIRARLTLLRAKAAYTWGRQNRYHGELVAFFTRHAHSVRTKHDFLRGFQPHFEAVMAFHKVFETKKGAGA